MKFTKYHELWYITNSYRGNMKIGISNDYSILRLIHEKKMECQTVCDKPNYHVRFF